jgi:hypothetical protein
MCEDLTDHTFTKLLFIFSTKILNQHNITLNSVYLSV